tara:strand:+ start:109 stop:750 length:642 start_codon:yes stop_codon:yes gene_type:complete
MNEYINHIIKKLDKSYRNINTELIYNSPFQLLIATILSAQCTDKIVNKTTVNLFKRYPYVRDLAEADIEDVKKLIKSTGYYKLKARRIINTSNRIIEKHNEKIPDNMQDLLELDGVGRKTANIVLSVAFNKNEGIAVDTHVARLSKRLNLTRNINPKKIENDLLKVIPEEFWGRISILFILHGRTICQAKKPDCNNCMLNNRCPYWKEALRNK